MDCESVKTDKGKGSEGEQLTPGFIGQHIIIKDFASKMPNLMGQMRTAWNKKNRRTRRKKNATESKDNTG